METVTEAVVIPMPDKWDSLWVQWHIPQEEFDAWVERLSVGDKVKTQTTNTDHGDPRQFNTVEVEINGIRVTLFSNNRSTRHIAVSVHRA